MPLFVIFVLVPLIEITLFIKVGGLIGLWPTLLIVLGTAIGGVWVMRRQGAAAMADLQRSFVELRDPTAPLAHGALIMLAGALLITPGFFTDACGLLLLIPPVRSWLMRRMRGRLRHVSRGFAPPGGGTVIDGDYMDEGAPPEDRQSGPRRPSGWTRPDLH